MSIVSKVPFTLVSLHLKANLLSSNGVTAPLKHHKAALFLDGLITAAMQGRAYTKADFLSSWAAHDVQAVPDRTAISRIVQTVRAALAVVLPNGASRVETETRALTTGPWRLVILPSEEWQVDGCHAPTANPEPNFTQHTDPTAWCHAANALAVADVMLAAGQYPEAIKLLESQLQTLGLSDAGWCMWAIRLARVQRRLGQYAQANALLLLLQKRSAALPWRMRAYVASKTGLLTARAAFDALPLQASLSVDFEKLRTVVDTAPNINLQWEWCNLRALAFRRQIERQLQANAQPQTVQHLVNEAMQTFGAAYFWASLAKDHYHCQAVACNFAYSLYWLDSKGLYDGLAASIAWFKLSHTLVDRFELPQDSAWDFLMLGDIYLSSSKARALIEQDALAWPEQTSPNNQAFYARALELARNHGGPRQEIIALNQLASFLHMRHCIVPRQAARAERDALMARHKEIVIDMQKDGFACG